MGILDWYEFAGVIIGAAAFLGVPAWAAWQEHSGIVSGILSSILAVLAAIAWFSFMFFYSPGDWQIVGSFVVPGILIGLMLLLQHWAERHAERS